RFHTALSGHRLLASSHEALSNLTKLDRTVGHQPRGRCDRKSLGSGSESSNTQRGSQYKNSHHNSRKGIQPTIVSRTDGSIPSVDGQDSESECHLGCTSMSNVTMEPEGTTESPDCPGSL